MKLKLLFIAIGLTSLTVVAQPKPANPPAAEKPAVEKPSTPQLQSQKQPSSPKREDCSLFDNSGNCNACPASPGCWGSKTQK